MSMLSHIQEYFPIIAAIAAMSISQLFKIITELIKNKTFNPNSLVVSGGMPSSHAALLTAITTAFAFQEGLGSPSFLITLSILMIITYDATGVRKLAGEQAQEYNKLLDQLPNNQKKGLKKLTVRHGHTHCEVVAGIILGITVASILYFYLSIH